MAVPARPSEDERGALQTVYSGTIVRVWEWTDDKQPNDTLKDLACLLGFGLDGESPPCSYVQNQVGEWWHLRKNGMRANDADQDGILKWVDKEQGKRLNEGLPLFGWKLDHGHWSTTKESPGDAKTGAIRDWGGLERQDTKNE